MIVTTASGRTLRITFVHSSPFKTDGSFEVQTRPNEVRGELRTRLDADAEILQRRLSLCSISEMFPSGPNETAHALTLGQGVALCHPSDTFDKAVGRKLALTYALEASELNRQERRDVWNEYLRVRNYPEPVDVEAVAARVHADWVQSKLDANVTSRLSVTGEELMVPYEDLSEEAKELDRATVRVVFKALFL